MRGSVLIFNSLDELDPETLDKIDDLSSLNSFDLEEGYHSQEESDKYSSSGSSENYCNLRYETTARNSMTHSQTESPSYQTQSELGNITTSNFNSNSEKANLNPKYETSSSHSNRSHHRVHGIRSNSNSQKAKTDINSSYLSSSPLNKSNYFQEPQTSHHSNSEYSANQRRVSTSMSSPKAFTTVNVGTVLPLSRITNKDSTSLIKTSNSTLLDNMRDQNSGGLSRFLSTLDFRSNKNDKTRFDVNNLSPRLREETKRIYVY